MTEWQHTDTIHVIVGSAELQIVGVKALPELLVTGTLVNIARGNCVLNVRESELPQVSTVGKLVINAHRPVMQGELYMGAEQFNCLLRGFANILPRPARFILALSSPLAVSLSGDLAINEETSCAIRDLSCVIPLY